MVGVPAIASGHDRVGTSEKFKKIRVHISCCHCEEGVLPDVAISIELGIAHLHLRAPHAVRRAGVQVSPLSAARNDILYVNFPALKYNSSTYTAEEKRLSAFESLAPKSWRSS